MENDKEKKAHLFVYGTLRKRGLNGHLLKSSLLLKENVSLPGYALYDAGWFPFAVPAPVHSFIVGDVFEVPLSLLPELDEYEGSEYTRKYLHEKNMLIYLKKEADIAGFPFVEKGDWLPYWETKNLKS